MAKKVFQVEIDYEEIDSNNQVFSKTSLEDGVTAMMYAHIVGKGMKNVNIVVKEQQQNTYFVALKDSKINCTEVIKEKKQYIMSLKS